MEIFKLINEIILFVVLPLYFYLFFKVLINDLHKKSYKHFCKSVKAVINSCLDDSECIRQINMNFKIWIEKFPDISSTIKNPVEILQKIVYEYDTIGSESFEKKNGVKLSLEDRNRIMSIVKYMKIENPFVSLSDKESTLLKNIKYSLENDDNNLSESMLTQLSNDIEYLETELKIQKESNKKSYILSILGLILTVLFGAMSLIPLIHAF